MPTEIFYLVRQAIAEKKQIVGTYSNHVREMCPHVVGWNKEGKEQALFYQFGGTSSSGPIEPIFSPNNWRCIQLDKLTNVSIRNGEWFSAANHSSDQTCVARVDLEVSL